MPSPHAISRTPLPRKLGIKVGHRVALLDAPVGVERLLARLPAEVEVRAGVTRGPFDVIVLFVTSERALTRRFAAAAMQLTPAGGLWVAWPKRASGADSDLSESAVRAVAVAAGLVDDKVCAIDETWSGLRCVGRRHTRTPRRPRR